jgi:hypothetical protein
MKMGEAVCVGKPWESKSSASACENFARAIQRILQTRYTENKSPSYCLNPVLWELENFEQGPSSRLYLMKELQSRAFYNDNVRKCSSLLEPVERVGKNRQFYFWLFWLNTGTSIRRQESNGSCQGYTSLPLEYFCFEHFILGRSMVIASCILKCE